MKKQTFVYIPVSKRRKKDKPFSALELEGIAPYCYSKQSEVELCPGEKVIRLEIKVSEVGD